MLEFKKIGDNYFQIENTVIYDAVRQWCAKHHLDWSEIQQVNYMVVHAESIDYWFDQLGIPWRESGMPLEYDGNVVRWHTKKGEEIAI